jgi:hypothetical protein
MRVTSPEIENLVRIGQLKHEALSIAETSKLWRSASLDDSLDWSRK